MEDKNFEKQCRKLLIFACITAFFAYGFLIFLAVINEIIRLMLIWTVIGLVFLALYGWYRIKKILEEEE